MVEVGEGGVPQVPHRRPRGLALAPGWVRARGRLHRRARVCQRCRHHLVLGVHLVEGLPGDTGPLEVRPRGLVLALVVVGQLGVEVGPGPAECGGPRGVPVAEGVQRGHEAVEVASEGPVDHPVHAHRRHRPRVGRSARVRRSTVPEVDRQSNTRVGPAMRPRSPAASGSTGRRRPRGSGRLGRPRRPARRRPRRRRCRRTRPTTGSPP